MRNEVDTGMAKEGLRTLAYAYKDVDIHTWDDMRRRFNDFATDEDKTNIDAHDQIIDVTDGLIVWAGKKKYCRVRLTD